MKYFLYNINMFFVNMNYFCLQHQVVFFVQKNLLGKLKTFIRYQCVLKMKSTAFLYRLFKLVAYIVIIKMRGILIYHLYIQSQQ